MNRPFYAFGVLLAGLGLTMLAVGNTSHATRLQRTDGRSNQEVETEAEAEDVRFCGCYVLVLPDADFYTESHSCDSSAQPSYDEGCGLDRLSGTVYPLLPANYDDFDCGGCDWWASQAAMRSAVVKLATTDGAPKFPAAVDVRAHYDPAYDAIVYGISEQIDLELQAADFDVDQALRLFQSLLVEPDSRDPATAGLRDALAAGQWLFEGVQDRLAVNELRAVALGAANFVRQNLEAADLLDEWQDAACMAGRDFPPDRFSDRHLAQSPAWDDYADWIDSPQVRSAEALATEGFAASGRSSREMLLFAAATLNHVAEVMQQAADQLAAVAGSDEVEFSRRTETGSDLK